MEKRACTPRVPREIYPSNPPMDSRYEYYEPNGGNLENGMVVIASNCQSADQELLRPVEVTNRWCTVTNVDVIDGIVKFHGVYADGSIHERRRSVLSPWLVRRDSVPKKPSSTPLSEDNIRVIVREELDRFMDELGKKAGIPQYMETERMVDAMVSVVETVSKKVANEEINKWEDSVMK